MGSEEKRGKEQSETWAYKLKAGVFLCATGGIAALFGFGGALAAAKKSDPSAFDQGLTGAVDGSKPPADGPNARHLRQQARLHQTGAALASKALAYGTLYACAGCAALFFALWKLSGAEDLQDFRRRAGAVLPVVPKNNPPQGRTEFSGINDFLTYVVEEDEKKKAQKRLEKDKQN